MNKKNNKQENTTNMNEENKNENSNEITIERDEKIGEDSNEETVQSKEEEELIFLRKKTTDFEKEINELKDRLLRKAAEFENYKKRNENDQLNLMKYAAESFIIKLLPTIDDFERSMKHLNDVKDVESLKSGLKIIYSNFIKTLEEQGVKKIESLNQPFDVTYHEALLQRNAPGSPPHTVVDEIETGYIYKDRVIRHAKVIVSDDNSEADKKDTADENKNEKNEAGE